MNDGYEVDRQLRKVAERRAALDAEEARLLREAERLQIWLPLGMVSVLDYMGAPGSLVKEEVVMSD